jgi:hypothetical protein
MGEAAEQPVTDQTVEQPDSTQTTSPGANLDSGWPEGYLEAMRESSHAQLDPARSRAEIAWQRAQIAWARSKEIVEDRARVRGVRELLQESELARLYARYVTMPVIEQAKGVLMAQQNCDAEQAFDLLRRASQRSNTPVRELAAKIVQHAQGQRPSRTSGKTAR